MKNSRMKYSIEQIMGYLRSRGIPQQMIWQIRVALTQDAIREAEGMQTDRVYSGIALALRRCMGFGPKRILRCLQAVEDVMTEMADTEKPWDELMKELKDETGIVVRTGDDERFIFEVGIEDSEVEDDEG